VSLFTITHVQRRDGYAVVQTLEVTEIGTGQEITISGTGTFNGVFTVLDVPPYEYEGLIDEDWTFNANSPIPNQLLFEDAGDDLEREMLETFGVLEWEPQCSWITSSDVTAWLGIEAATENDETFIDTATAAANAWAYRRRREAGYFDALDTSPGPDATLGTIMYAGALYRERGSVDSFASFEQMGPAMPFGSSSQINRLLGINRSQIA